ncbi:Uncharacterised protein [BD1-7 clade bacterium]|uniref:Uncharacterized protein n=1 Tax=BD1-7 clade bacterium TaxID=2029982 RepID=A0A5S9PKB4_9GAMM|nr:Uncharacterised protein [BD1-7 clade bacterium]CAA0104555.1 Uncharacterised protein [BD1-7 clade bacterium]
MLTMTLFFAFVIVLNTYATARLFNGARGDTWKRQRLLAFIWAAPVVGAAASMLQQPILIPISHSND